MIDMSKLRSQLNKLASDRFQGENGQPPVKPGNNPVENRSYVNESFSHINQTNPPSVYKEPRQDLKELAEIKAALSGLTRQLTNQSQQAAQFVTRPPERPAKCKADLLDTNALAGTLAGTLSQSLRENLHEQMSEEINKMRSELSELQQSANNASDQAIMNDIQRISQGIRELQERQVVSPDQFGEMAGELRGMHRQIRDLGEKPDLQFDTGEIARSIQSNYDEIAKRLESIGTSGLGNQFEALSNKLEELQANLTSSDPQLLARIEGQLQALGQTISTLTKVQESQPSNAFEAVLPEYFEGLDRRMDEITRAVMASAPSAAGTADEAAFERIEARIASLAKAVENFAHDNAVIENNPHLADLYAMPDMLNSRLAELENNINALSATGGISEIGANEELKAQLAALTQKIDHMNLASADDSSPVTVTNHDNDQINAKLDQLTLTIERAINSGDGSVGQLESQIAELSNRIDSIVNIDHTKQQDQSLNETRVVEELQSLARRVERLDASFADSPSPHEQFAALENQIKSISSQLESVSGQADLSSIEDRLGGIEKQFIENRELVIDMASNAVAQNGSTEQNSTLAALAEDLQSLTRSSSELKGHSLETFEAVRESLSMILDRINSIEMRIATEEISTGMVEPLPAPVDEIHSAQMVDAAREYATSLSQQEADHNQSARLVPDAQSPENDLPSIEPRPDDPLTQYTADAGKLPQVDAPSLDLEHMPPIENSLPQSDELAKELAGNDTPLEPGSGAPDLAGDLAAGPDIDSLMRQAKENKRKSTLEEEQQNPTDFIAAARRAAQAAANEENAQVLAEQKAPKVKKSFSIGNLLGKRKKMLMLGAAALVFTALAVPAISYFTDTDESRLAFQDNSDLMDGSENEPSQNAELLSEEIGDSDIGDTANADLQNSEMIMATSQNDGTQGENTNLPSDLSLPSTMNPQQLSNDSSLLPASQHIDNEEVAGILQNDISNPGPDDNARTFEMPDTKAGSSTQMPMPPKEIGPIALRQAAANGDLTALFEVGRRYTQGVNEAPDLKEAAIWYHRAAQNGYAPAQYRLGNIYEKGHGVESDVKEAANWYRKAALQGNALAMHNLAVINAMGVLEGGVNMNEATKWFEMAAEHGVKDSQVNLGIIYAKAMGVEVDLAQAYKWFAIAAKAGDKDAARKRDTVAKQMRPDQLKSARGAVELWKPRELNKAANTVDIPAEWNTGPQITASLSSKQMILKTQALLAKLGFNPGPADGVIGSNTTKAIKEFQARAGISVNGKVTPELIQALEKST